MIVGNLKIIEIIFIITSANKSYQKLERISVVAYKWDKKHFMTVVIARTAEDV